MKLKQTRYYVELTKEEGRKALDLYYHVSPLERTKSEDIVANTVFTEHYYDRGILEHKLDKKQFEAFVEVFSLNVDTELQ